MNNTPLVWTHRGCLGIGAPAISELNEALHDKVYVTFGRSMIGYAATDAVAAVDSNRAQNRGPFLRSRHACGFADGLRM